MNYYKRAIEILDGIDSTSSVGSTSLLFKIAASNPSAIVRAFDRKQRNTTPKERDHLHELENRCRELWLAGMKVQAVKEWRNATGDTLTDSVEKIKGMAGV